MPPMMAPLMTLTMSPSVPSMPIPLCIVMMLPARAARDPLRNQLAQWALNVFTPIVAARLSSSLVARRLRPSLVLVRNKWTPTTSRRLIRGPTTVMPLYPFQVKSR